MRLAFQCLQLVVTDFLPLMPWACLPLTVDTAAKFGSQTQELNISLTAIGLMVSWASVVNLKVFGCQFVLPEVRLLFIVDVNEKATNFHY